MNGLKRTVAVTGASRGLGLVLVKEFLAGGDTVFALVRNAGEELPALRVKHPETLTIVSCDVASTESVCKAAEEVSACVDHLDLLINNAGVNPDLENAVDFTQTDFDGMGQAFNINIQGVMRVVKAFDRFMKSGSCSAAISSSAGSITQNTEIDVMYAYRVSKTALNMAFRLYSNTVKKRKVRTLLIDPGWMRTAMGGPGAECDPEVNGRLIAEMLKNADSISEEILFINYQGKEVPW